MNKKKRIGIIGHFGAGHVFFDGQTIKTRILYDELEKTGEFDLFCVDTYLLKKNPIKLLYDSIRCILSCKAIILLLSGNGMKVYFPMMYWAKKLFRKKIYHDVIGGNLAAYVQKYPRYKTYLSAFDGNWVELNTMKTALEKEGITNCIVIPNFKRLNTEAARLEISDEEKHSFCMFSRVMEEKGITDAILAVSQYNQEHSIKAKLNIWGQIDDSYKEEFDHLLSTYGDCVSYNGKISYSESAETLTPHIALLFPTFWRGEGFPGTIVDAYTAGVPVIASDWNANAELIDNFETGWVYANTHINNLYDSISWAMEHRDEMLNMRPKCIKKAKEYMPDKWVAEIVGLLRGN